MTKTPEVRISRIRLRWAPVALAALVAIGLGLVPIPTAKAQTLTIIHSFAGPPDGETPEAGLIRDEAGNLYGTTYYGGVYGAGAVFKLDAFGSETVLYSFGAYPGDGTILLGGLIRDRAGNLYGTTRYGGESDYGTIFKLDTSGNETVLYSFAGSPTDGAYPSASLIRDKAGNLYGTTTYGGSGTCQSLPPFGCGTVFKFDTSGNETVLHNFTGSPGDGAFPSAALIADRAGNLYGTTANGGAFNSTSVPHGCGTVFKLDTSGTETVLYSFAGQYGAFGDGLFPPSANLIMDEAKNLYGVTFLGGASGDGTVFKLDSRGKLTVLHSFAGPPSDGANPLAAPIMDERGTLYGTTVWGGSGFCDYPGLGCGTVYVIDRFGKETVLHSFTNSPDDGAIPVGLVMDRADNLYGTTNGGGAAGYGTVFELISPTPQQATQTIIGAVNALYSEGALSRGEYNALVQRLQQAILLMNAGRDGHAAENFRAFIREVLDLQRSGVLSQSQATPLISAAEAVIAQLS